MSFKAYRVTNVSNQNVFLEEGIVAVGTTRRFKNYSETMEIALTRGLILIEYVTIDDERAVGHRTVFSDTGKIGRGDVNADDDVYRLLKQANLLDDEGNPIGGSGSSAASMLIPLLNEEAFTITIGQAVYNSSASAVKLAIANDIILTEAIGLVADTTIQASTIGDIQSKGALTATIAQWDVVTGQSGGLTTGLLYYLDDVVPGKLISTPPTINWQLCVGQALSPTQMLIDIRESIKL
jgi:hypothetical protein